MPVFRLAPSILLLAASLAAAGALAADVPGTVEPAAAVTPSTPAPAPEAASAAVHPAHPQNPLHHAACLSKSEQRAAVASKSAMSLGDAIKSLRAHGRRAEVVRARLCRRDEKLVYVLTLLGRSGRVREVNVDAVSGDLIAGR
jgi:hypothetical protein